MLYIDTKDPVPLARPFRLAVLSALAALIVSACGGGGGSPGATLVPVGDSTTTTPVSTTTTTVVVEPGPPDVIQASAVNENFCAVPRTGIDPFTGEPYPDKQGTLDQEKAWVRGWIDETYLWYDQIPSTIRAASYTNPKDYFNALRTSATTPSGKPLDQFHFTYDTSVWRALTQAGIEVGYGFDLSIVNGLPPRDARIAYVDPGTPAAAAGITRGDRIVAIDDIDLITSATVAALNAASFPTKAGETHKFTLQALDGSRRTVSLTSAEITKTPVQNVRTLDTPAGKVGYLLFNDHVVPSEAQLIAAIEKFKTDGVQDLVLDVRYNGGGLLDIASELAYMIATPQAVAGAVFERLQFNDKNPFQLSAAQTATSFHATSQGFSTPAGQALPQLGLSRVTVLTGPQTCSASESVINSLRGINVDVTQIGNTTCGKPYGFVPRDNCGTTYFTVQFKGVNNKNFGDFADGLAPTCTVGDDFTKQLGDPAEARLAAALRYRATGQCPPLSDTAVAKSALKSAIGEALVSGKSAARNSLILRDGAFNRR